MRESFVRVLITSSSLFALVIALVVGFAVPVAADQPPVKSVVVIDLTKGGKNDVALEGRRSRWPEFPGVIWVSAAPEPEKLREVKTTLDEFSKAGTLPNETRVLTALTSLPLAADPTRMVSHADDHVLLILLADYSDEHVPVSVVKETKRLTQLAQDLEKLVTTVTKKIAEEGVAERKEEPTIQVVAQQITLKERRATVTIGARSVRMRDEPTTIAEDSCKNGDCVQRTLTIATGPVELLFLSLDLPVTKTSDLVYDSASGTLQPQTTPTVVFLGFDVAFGDILTKPRSVGWSSFVLKGFIKLSSRPSDAFGFGLGFRPPRMELGGMPLELFQVFGAYVWTKQDGVTATGAPESSSSYKRALRAGVSFNLDKLGDWLKL
jgi:hypothetical protein